MKYDRSNIDLPKLRPVEHNSFDAWIMVVSYEYTSISYSLWLCQSGICGRSDMNKRGFIAGVPYPLSSIPLPFLLPPNPLPLSTPATQSALAFFLFGEGDNAVSLIVLYSKKFVNFLIHKFRLSLGSSGSC